MEKLQKIFLEIFQQSCRKIVLLRGFQRIRGPRRGKKTNLLIACQSFVTLHEKTVTWGEYWFVPNNLEGGRPKMLVPITWHPAECLAVWKPMGRSSDYPWQPLLSDLAHPAMFLLATFPILEKKVWLDLNVDDCLACLVWKLHIGTLRNRGFTNQIIDNSSNTDPNTRPKPQTGFLFWKQKIFRNKKNKRKPNWLHRGTTLKSGTMFG